MESGQHPPDAKSDPRVHDENTPAALTGAPPVAIRRYPKPPSLPLRILLLCLKPEAWAAAARYPSRFTMIPLALVVLIASLIVGIAQGIRFRDTLNNFSHEFPPMQISSDGILKPKQPLAHPVGFNFFPLRFIIDPTNKTTLAATNDTYRSVLVNDHEIVIQWFNDSQYHAPLQSLATLGFPLPPKGQTALIDASTLQHAAPQIGALVGTLAGVAQLLRDTLWTLLMMFFLVPIITLAASLGERSLLLPKRAAYRMAAGLLLPLVLFDAIMHAAGYDLLQSVGPDISTLIWFAGAAAMAIWTGILARKMYAPTSRKNRSPQ